MIIFIIQTIVIISVIFLLIKSMNKNINKKIDDIKIHNVDLSNIEKLILESKEELLTEIKKSNAGEIILEDGKVKGNLFIKAKGEVSAFDGGVV